MADATIEHLFHTALAHHQAGRLAQAEAGYREILARQGDHTQTLGNLGILLGDMGQLAAAVGVLRQAIALKPDWAEAYYNLGVTLKDQGDRAAAIKAYHKALELKPDWAVAYVNLGSALLGEDQIDEAISAFRQAIVVQPDLAQAHQSLGHALREQGRLDEAMVSYRQTMALRPEWSEARSNWVFTLNYIAQDPAALLREHKEWARRYAAVGTIEAHTNERTPQRRLRVGYVSPDFREHVVGRQLLDVLPRHDRKALEVFCYANVAVEDRFSQRMRAAVDHWRNITGIDDEAVAAQIRADGIDVLVDLAVHSAQNRLGVFAHKPAPVQVTHMGYPATTGLAVMDYRITDAILDPPGTGEQANSEKLMRLRGNYYCFTRPPEPAVRARPAGAVTFACLNNLAKITDAAVELWAMILRDVPDAKIILPSARGPDGDRRQLARWAWHGVPSERIELSTVRGAEYMALYHRIDIALDSFPFNGANITFDALWMGVPVVSLWGQTSVGRAGASILGAVGLGELVAQSPQEYVEMAVDLAGDPARRAHLRAGMRRRLEQSVLMDAAGYTRDLEAAYRQMWRNWCAGA